MQGMVEINLQVFPTDEATFSYFSTFQDLDYSISKYIQANKSLRFIRLGVDILEPRLPSIILLLFCLHRRFIFDNRSQAKRGGVYLTL